MNKVRWGIIGCGDVTEVKSGPGFREAEGSELVMVMRRNGALAEDYARRHGVPRWTDDANALIHDPGVDAVYIATPPAFHKDYTLEVAAAGKPVYVEKPMAFTHADCQEMIAACKGANVPLFVAYYRRMLPRFLKVKELLEAGAIGEPRLVTVTLYQPPSEADLRDEKGWRVIPELAGGGHFMDLACHTLDVLDYLLGPIEQVAGSAANQGGLYDAEDIVTGQFVFASGVQGVGSWCFTAAQRWDLNEIIGTAGKLSFSTFGTEPVKLITPEGAEAFAAPNPKHVQQPLIQTIVDELLGRGRCPSTGESAARTAWVMDGMLNDYRKRKKGRT